MAIGPVTSPTPSIRTSFIEAAGGVVSTTIGYSPVCEVPPPLGAGADTANMCEPSASGASGRYVQRPSSFAVVLATFLPSMKIWTILPAAAVPVTVGCESFVTPNFSTLPT
ncbi:hypothetical protein MJ546_07035 [Burkholderia gladioli]|nr:hypothetical protein [Burkholderia gladioli]